MKLASDKELLRNNAGTRPSGPSLMVRADSVVILGLPPELTALPVSQTQGLCGQVGPETSCSLSVPPGSGLAQLPVLFYPSMLDVRVDGQRAPYLPLVHRDFVLAGVPLPPGNHDVRVRFEGFAWANWVSGTAWLGAIAAFGASALPVRRLRWRAPYARRADVYG